VKSQPKNVLLANVFVTNNIYYFSRNRYQTDFISAQEALNSL